MVNLEIPKSATNVAVLLESWSSSDTKPGICRLKNLFVLTSIVLWGQRRPKKVRAAPSPRVYLLDNTLSMQFQSFIDVLLPLHRTTQCIHSLLLDYKGPAREESGIWDLNSGFKIQIGQDS